MHNRFGFYKNKKKCQLNNNRHFKKLPNQGSNLDFTDPESVVLPITPLGNLAVAKIRKIHNS